jgi:hypothetical protein
MRIFTRCKRLSTISRESFAKRSNVCLRASPAASRAMLGGWGSRGTMRADWLLNTRALLQFFS